MVHVLGYGLEDWFEGDLYPVRSRVGRGDSHLSYHSRQDSSSCAQDGQGGHSVGAEGRVSGQFNATVTCGDWLSETVISCQFVQT